MNAENKSYRFLYKILSALTVCLTMTFVTGCYYDDDCDYWYDDHDSWYDEPDLVDRGSSNHYLPDRYVYIGDPFAVGLEVQSNYDYSGSHVTRFYLSSNSTISNSDILIATYYSNGIDWGDHEHQIAYLSHFPSVYPGEYYIGAIIDADDDVDELDEYNNIVRFYDRVIVVDPWYPASLTEATTNSINEAPEAVVMASDTLGSVGNRVFLTGSGSVDPDNGPEILTYTWRCMDFPVSSNCPELELLDEAGMGVAFVPEVAGTYTFELTVSDGEEEASMEAVVLVQ